MIASVGQVGVKKRLLMRRYRSSYNGIQGVGRSEGVGSRGGRGGGIGLQDSEEVEGVAESRGEYKVGLRLCVRLMSLRG
jgi:hypothetical protein